MISNSECFLLFRLLCNIKLVTWATFARVQFDSCFALVFICLFVCHFVGPNVRHKWKDLPGRFLRNLKPPMKPTILFNKRSPNQRRLCRPRRVRWVFWLFSHSPSGNNMAGCLKLADVIQLKLNDSWRFRHRVLFPFLVAFDAFRFLYQCKFWFQLNFFILDFLMTMRSQNQLQLQLRPSPPLNA